MDLKENGGVMIGYERFGGRKGKEELLIML